ncbi:PREDICTED: DNA-directed primase/polymerase protein-like [Polistes dominula]|uniref:DNA-directed primase/polymerase protein n=1 Tax=Polistes dominula TaxID=743375 RepID=A0ABM1HVN8_POLDO|nr:PREDICTED: DNA-directed primase/polymerase protein-like [Polistes dominula]
MNEFSPEKFYGKNMGALKPIDRNKKCKKELNINCLRKMPDHILGPSQFWAEFYKQAEALAVANKHSNDNEMLCTFVYQQNDGIRKFVVAHPEVYWWYYKDRPPESRCSYEVIPEGAPCWLYVDLEFLYELNPNSNGSRMTNTLIDILCAFMLKEWHLPCNKFNIINLDSTNNEKFSRHLIFAIKDVAFKDNFHVGKFMKYVCMEITNYLNNTETHHDILSTFSKIDIEELIINMKNGRKLFIDVGVYTKNRHFRIYKSTKWGKQSHLEISSDCKFILPKMYKEPELEYFINSLIAYFPRKKDIILLEFSNGEAQVITHSNKEQRQRINNITSYNTSSQYPEIDKYILDIIKPGKIRLCKYNEQLKTLIYEIIGYRYCENIGRWHKSNNIYLIVDITKQVIYQKCHDEECSDFLSSPKKLPEEINFQLDLDDEVFISYAMLAEEACFNDDSFTEIINT